MPDVLLQPAASVGLDTELNEDSPTTNFGTSTVIGLAFVGTQENVDGIIKFDLSIIQSGSEIQEATLSLYLQSAFGGGLDYEIYRVKSANNGWDEGTATWNTIDGTASWAGTAGCGTSGTDYDTDPLWAETVDMTTGQFHDHPLVLGVFQKVVDVSNSGFLIRCVVRNPSVSRNALFSSSDTATASQRPKLFVRWIEPTGRQVEYTFNIFDPQKRILDAQGSIVQPNEVRPDNWIKTEGVELPSGRAYSTLVQDPTTSYIVGASFDERGVRIQTDRNQFAELIIKRVAGGV